MQHIPAPKKRSQVFSTPVARLLYDYFGLAVAALAIGVFFIIRGVRAFSEIEYLRSQVSPLTRDDYRFLLLTALHDGYGNLCIGGISLIAGLIGLMIWLVKRERCLHMAVEKPS